MNKKIKISRVKEKDLQKLMETCVAAYTEDNKLKPSGVSQNLPPDSNTIEGHRKWMMDTKYYKITYNNQIVGAGMVTIDKNKNGHVSNMFISPEYQNKGLGQKLLDHLIKNNSRIKNWFLMTQDYSKRNYYFYKKMGFKKVGINKELVPILGFELIEFKMTLK